MTAKPIEDQDSWSDQLATADDWKLCSCQAAIETRKRTGSRVVSINLMVEAIKTFSLKNTHLLQGISVKFHSCVVGECDKVGLTEFPLILLP